MLSEALCYCNEKVREYGVMLDDYNKKSLSDKININLFSFKGKKYKKI